MPVFPLFDEISSDPELPRHVRAPGGYDWWRLSALNDDDGSSLAIDFFEGSPLDPAYLAGYVAYRRRPTGVAPPAHRRTVVISLNLPKPRGLVSDRFESTQGNSDPDQEIIPGSIRRVGKQSLVRQADGSWTLSLRVPFSTGALLETRLRWVRTDPASPVELDLHEKGELGGVHSWVAVAPTAEVTGTIYLGGAVTEFRGKGSYTRRFGVAPLPIFADRWMWGSAIAGKRVVSWEVIRPAGASSDQVYFIEPGPSQANAHVGGRYEIDSVIDAKGRLSISRPGRFLQTLGAVAPGEPNAVVGKWDGQPLRGVVTMIVTKPVQDLYAPVMRVVKH